MAGMAVSSLTDEVEVEDVDVRSFVLFPFPPLYTFKERKSIESSGCPVENNKGQQVLTQSTGIDRLSTRSFTSKFYHTIT